MYQRLRTVSRMLLPLILSFTNRSVRLRRNMYHSITPEPTT